MITKTIDIKIYINTRWFKYDRDYLCVNKSQFVPVIFEPPCIILPIVLNGCETWSLTFWEKCRMRVFEKKVLRTIFKPKMNDVTEE